MTFVRTIRFLSVFFALMGFSWASIAETKNAEFTLFSRKYSVFYDSSILVDFPYKPNDDDYFQFYYNRMDTTIYEVLLKDLQTIKQDLHLNDWMYFLFLKNTIQVIFSSQKEHFQNLFLWFMLCKSNYDARIEFKGKEITVSVLSYDLIYGVPQQKGKGGYFVDLTSFSNSVDYVKWEPYRPDFNPNKGHETVPFSFTILEFPNIFDSRIGEKSFSFSHKEKKYLLKIPIDSGYVDFLKDYPELSVLKHTELMLSPNAQNTLIPFLKEQVMGMDTIQTIRFLMSFCRTAFKIKKDELVFAETPYFSGAGTRIIFSPEESLLSNFVDSEDISVLFYYLAKEIIKPEMVLLKYGKRVSVAVNVHQKTGTPVLYNNKPYLLCDVSENDDSVEIGQIPKSLAGKSPSFIEK